MAKVRTRKDQKKGLSEYYQVRLTKTQRSGINVAAGLSSLSVASWVRTTLLAAAKIELGKAGKPIPFMV